MRTFLILSIFLAFLSNQAAYAGPQEPENKGKPNTEHKNLSTTYNTGENLQGVGYFLVFLSVPFLLHGLFEGTAGDDAKKKGHEDSEATHNEAATRSYHVAGALFLTGWALDIAGSLIKRSGPEYEETSTKNPQFGFMVATMRPGNEDSTSYGLFYSKAL